MTRRDEPVTPLIVIMGVAGSGKTTVGVELARRLDWAFFEGDDFHPPANIEKMAGGQPLTDEDRQIWIAAIAQAIEESEAMPAVLACSALSPTVREWLSEVRHHRLHWVLLEISEDEAYSRVSARQGHFMPAGLITSQFAALAPPQDAIRLDATAEPSANTVVIVEELKARAVLSASSGAGDRR